jgi:hypothetical protein
MDDRLDHDASWIPPDGFDTRGGGRGGGSLEGGQFSGAMMAVVVAYKTVNVYNDKRRQIMGIG